uniref:Uncharacterized protein n=1 Tax=Caenorhabditis japonica TaxID=281687 RepID=A0A8R1I797_CAEJA
MALIRGRQMGPDMPTLVKQFKTSKSVIWATLNTPNRSKATGRPLKTSSGDSGIIVRMSQKNPRLTSTDINSELKDQYGVQDSVQGHCQKTSAPRFTLQKAPSEQANDSGEEPFSSTEVDKGSSALGWNKVLWSDESKYLMIGTDGVTLVRRPGDKRNDPKYQVPTVKHGGGTSYYGSWVVIPTGQRSEAHFPLRQGLVRTASSERFDLAKPIYRPESHRASLGATQGRMDQNPTSDSDELDRVHAKRCETVIKAKGMATKY